ncbi:MAG: hypothetical protein TYPL_2430 [Candidatus Tyloplasma litorale]|nr:MAG: hypothetical protein TYPL_2430 [Mycoplasmatales bacterium]
MNILMKFQNTSLTSLNTKSSSLSDGLNYFLLFALFFLVILFIVVIIYFAKWLTLGPGIKRFWGRITGKNKDKKIIDGVYVKGKEVVVDDNYLNEIDQGIENARTPQELIDYQSKKEKHEKQKELAIAEIRKKEEAKLAKIELKEERIKIAKEAKQHSKKVKEEAKRVKRELKENKKKEGDK